MMRLPELLAATLLVALVPASAGPVAAVRDDPLDRVRRALEDGRPWHAAHLLLEMDAAGDLGPEADLLAARADAARGVWEAVARRLGGAKWLDSLAYGEGRALLARAWLETGAYVQSVVAYRVFLEYSVERRPRALAELGLARALEALGQAGEAAAAYARAAQVVSELEPWVSIRAAENLAERGDTAAVRALVERADAVPSYRRRMAEVRAFEIAGDERAVVQRLLDKVDSPSETRRRGELHARAASIQLRTGDTAAAIGTLRTAVRLAPEHSREAAVLLFDMPELSADDYLELARAFDRSGTYANSAKAYKRYVQVSAPSGKDAQRLRLKIGELYYRAGLYWLAIEELERLVAEDPGPAIASRAQYLVARATYRRGWRREGRTRLREVADRYPGTASALRALALLADLHESDGNNARARAIYEELIRDYPGSRSARQGSFQLGLLDYQSGEYAGATAHFDRLRGWEAQGELHVAASYWAARSRLSRDDPDAIEEAERLLRHTRDRDPYGYYGLLAAARLGSDPWEALPNGPEPQPVDPETLVRFDLIELLNEAGLHEEAAAVIESILGQVPGGPEAMLGLSAVLAERGFGLQAVRLGWKAHARLRGQWSQSVLKAIYPLAFADLIQAESRTQDLPPYLVAAIARQESAFAPGVVSRAGARGLLQIMPETGRWWANRLGIRDYSLDALFHPEINVHLGVAYFADLQRRYGDLQLSLIAYNAGPTRARRWRERPSYNIDAELFAEQIPFSETRTYVRNIQTQMQIYRHLYADLSASEPAD